MGDFKIASERGNEEVRTNNILIIVLHKYGIIFYLYSNCKRNLSEFKITTTTKFLTIDIMEQIVKTLLKKQGIERIGQFNQGISVWFYVKDDKVHFCKDDLTEIDRHSLTIESNIVVLSEIGSSYHVMKEDDMFSNFIVIDENNNILVSKYVDDSNLRTPNPFLLKTIDENDFVIVHLERWNECNYITCGGYSLFETYIVPRYQRYKAYAFIGNHYYPEYELGFVYKNTFFFSYSTENNQAVIALNKKNGIIYHEEGDTPYIWIHENGDAQIISLRNVFVKDGEYKCWFDSMKEEEFGFVKILTIENNWSYSYRISDFMLPVKLENNCIIDTYEKINLYSNNYIVIPFSGNWAFVINYVQTWNPDELISLYTIEFNQNIRNTYTCSCKIELKNEILKIEQHIENDGYYDYYYDIYGNSLGTFRHEETYKNYFIFTTPNRSLLSNKISKLRGVLNIHNLDIVVPPLFEKVEIIDDENGLFEITFTNCVRSKLHQIKGVYSAYDGFIVPLGLEYHIDNLINETTFSDKHVKKYVVYTNGNKKGVIYNGKKLLNAEYDEICEGYFFNKYAYYIVERLGKKEVISDDNSFNNRSNIEYDDVLYDIVFKGELYFIVEKNEKLGAICTNEENNIPFVFDDIPHLVNSGVICGDILYDKNGNELFVLGDKYKHIKTKYYDVFKSNASNDFVFINSQGKIINNKRDEEDNNIIHVEGFTAPFDVVIKDFIEKEDEDCCYDYNSDYTQKELDDMFRAAYEDEPNAQWNTD